MAQKLKVNDFGMFIKAMKALSGAVEGIKVIVGPEQTKVLSKNPVARIKMTTNALVSDEPAELNIGNVISFVKLLEIANSKLGEKDKVSLSIDGRFIKITSKPVRSKLLMIEEDRIMNSIDKEFGTVLSETCRFRTTPDSIKELKRSSFIFADASTAKVYLFTDEDSKGKLKAELGNRRNESSNAITLDFGIVQSGDIGENVILNFDRLDMFTLLPDIKEIDVVLPNVRALISNQKIEKDDIYVNLWIMSSLVKG